MEDLFFKILILYLDGVAVHKEVLVDLRAHQFKVLGSNIPTKPTKPHYPP